MPFDQFEFGCHFFQYVVFFNHATSYVIGITDISIVPSIAHAQKDRIGISGRTSAVFPICCSWCSMPVSQNRSNPTLSARLCASCSTGGTGISSEVLSWMPLVSFPSPSFPVCASVNKPLSLQIGGRSPLQGIFQTIVPRFFLHYAQTPAKQYRRSIAISKGIPTPIQRKSRKKE
jgi:hypothetical protein